ncbi:septation protein SepH [Motilibacter deserti]|uniref:DUF3071 domain-containing protein n=1 Tax=Motilibacter deserti TaxID=2714956 RepID=A0ABX0GW14_9ACTN|nr:septation protein SepH [Motilibacter deserti]NHC13829.1 DUF3071 domain-containing protein [Motilibacter deserti]
MLDLRLVTVSDDGASLILADEKGEQYALPVDEALTAAVRGDRSRLGQLQIDTGELRPREIQTRVRAGESPEALSTETGVALERVRRYAGPVLAERQHVAEMAQRAAARRVGAPEGPASVLVDVVTGRLEAAGVDLRSLRWDAWRREDGRWTVEAAHATAHAVALAAGAGPSRGRFTFDAATRAVSPDDEHARWLLGEEPVRRPFVPRIAGSADPALPVEPGLTVDDVVDAAELLDDEAAAAVHDEDGEPTADAAPAPDEPADDPGRRRDRRAGRRARRASAQSDRLTGSTDRQALADGVKPGSRASVPSWDEILFGTRPKD